MGTWDIRPSGVQGVLQRTHAVAGEFEGQVRALNAALEDAAVQSSSDIVAGAISGFGAAAQSSVEFVFTRTGAAMGGAAQAVNAYIRGDLEMAANAQASASAAPDPRGTMPGGPRREGGPV